MNEVLEKQLQGAVVAKVQTTLKTALVEEVKSHLIDPSFAMQRCTGRPYVLLPNLQTRIRSECSR